MRTLGTLLLLVILKPHLPPWRVLLFGARR